MNKLALIYFLITLGCATAPQVYNNQTNETKNSQVSTGAFYQTTPELNPDTNEPYDNGDFITVNFEPVNTQDNTPDTNTNTNNPTNNNNGLSTENYIILFEDINFGGKSQIISEEVADLDNTDLGSYTSSSLKIVGNIKAEVCLNENFRNPCFTLAENYADLSQYSVTGFSNLSDKIVSIRPVTSSQNNVNNLPFEIIFNEEDGCSKGDQVEETNLITEGYNYLGSVTAILEAKITYQCSTNSYNLHFFYKNDQNFPCVGKFTANVGGFISVTSTNCGDH